MKKLFLTRKILVSLILGFILLPGFEGVIAQENSPADISRRNQDSLNVYHRRDIRLNQIGYRPQDARKYAFVANKSGSFQVINVKDGSAAYSGTLTKITDTAPAGKMTVRGVFNSITDLYNFSFGGGTESLYLADFSQLQQEGRFMVKIDKDTSAVFYINARIYNYILETALKFFGSNRCGNTDSWIHDPCHLKDGSDLGSDFTGALSGGWHDCGDHGKYAATQSFASLMLALTYVLFPYKAEDLFGKSYEITVPDGIPDILYEAKIGADYIFKLYKASKKNGLIAGADMYHSVGDKKDHSYWDVPENQEAQPASKGGPPRPVHKTIGSSIAGKFCATLAFFSWSWQAYDKPYADSLKNAAIDIYDNIVMKKLNTPTTNIPGYEGGDDRQDDDEAMAALSLWFVTKEARFGYDLYENKNIKNNPNYIYVPGQFPAGHLGANRYFHHGGWTTDYQNIHAFTIYAFIKLILKDDATAAQYGMTSDKRKELLDDCIALSRLSIKTGSNGSNQYTGTAPDEVIMADEPYHGVFTSADWGFNRYNMGIVNELFMYWDVTGVQNYFNIGIDNLNYNMGQNPWDMSFIMGVGDRNLQHPHNRAANPDGYNAGGFPYDYTCPTGAFMGGCKPGKDLLDDWEDYTATETCIDFSAQFILPAMILSSNSIIDTTDLLFFNVVIEQVGRDFAVVSWETNKMSRDVLRLALQRFGAIIQEIDAGPFAMKKRVRISGLTANTTYYFYLFGTTMNNTTGIGDNNGQWYSFTTLRDDLPDPEITDVRVCNITHNQATVYWWTKNVKSDSKVEYGTTASLGTTKTGDDSGVPFVNFHSVTLTNLLPNTTYWFDVISGNIRDNNKGSHYSFKTTEVLVNYDIRIKPTKKGGGSLGTAHFYIDLTNRESQPYTGLEIRFYFQLPDSEASKIIINSFDKAIFDAGGTMQPLDLAINSPVKMTKPGFEKYWYIALVIKSELPVAGRARIECQFNKNGWDNVPFSKFSDAWSIAPHTLPVPFAGVDLTKGDVYVGPDFVETVNGVPEVTYVKTQYITAFYNGIHVYGYPPDYEDNIPQSYKTVVLHFTKPFESPLAYIKQDSFDVDMAGRAWAYPDGNITHIEKNGTPVSFTPINSRKDSVSFADHILNLVLGANTFTYVAWHNKLAEDCGCDQKRVTIEVDTGNPVLPPTVSRAAYYDANGDGFADSVNITYTDTLSQLPDSAVLHWPDKSGERKKLLKNYTGMKFTADKKTILISVAPAFTAVQTAGSGKGQTWHQFIAGGASTPVPEFDIIDSVGPRLLKAYLYDKFGAGTDTLLLEFSEKIKSADITQAAGTSFILIKQGNNLVNLVVQGTIGTTDTSSLLIVLPDYGAQAPVAGDSLKIYAPGPVKDALSNKAHKNNPPVPLQLIAKPVPIDSASYWDLDANGIVELLKIKLRKKVSIGAIEKVNVYFGADAATAGSADISYSAIDSQTIQIMLTGIFTQTVLKNRGTGGLMNVAIYYNGLTAPESGTAIDKAAPVIASAHYIPGHIVSETDKKPDTLAITFTEDVLSNTSSEPFLFYNVRNLNTYQILMASVTYSASSAKALVDTIMGRKYPGNGDSVWINTVASITDLNSNAQINDKNLRVPMKVDPLPLNLVIKPVSPVVPQQYRFPNKIIGQLAKSVPFETGVYIRIDPQTDYDEEKIFQSVSIQILDAVGNIVASCNTIDAEGNLLCIRTAINDQKLHIFWSGKNRNSRFVGHGVYAVLIEVTDIFGMKAKKRVSVGVLEK